MKTLSPSPENPCFCECHPGKECLDCLCGRHKTKMKPKPKEDVREWEKTIWSMFGRYDSDTGVCIGTVQMESPQIIVSVVKGILSRQREELAGKIEGMKKNYGVPDYQNVNGKAKHVDINNQAVFERIIDRIIKLIKEYE